MRRKQEGFTLIELMVAMVVFVLTIVAATSIFAPLLTQFKQQSKSAETQIEGIVGLETLRRDIEQAGYGLPWNIPSGVTYQEATGSPASSYNDSATNPPRAILSGDGTINNPVIGASDYLVIKSTIVGTSNAAPQWTYIVGNGAGGGYVKTWGSSDDLNYGGANPWVIALIPSRGENETSQRILVNNGSTFSVQYSGVVGSFSPALKYDKYLVYGVDSNTSLRMPFNRADYYIATTGVSIPPRCASGTGVLVKSVVNQNNGALGTGIPIMDCVADMEVVYSLDVNNTGNITYYKTGINGLTAQQIRDEVKEVRVYILSHEGQKDAAYDASASTNYPTGKVKVGEFGLGDDFDLTQITDWKRYRWRVYTLIVQPKNLL